MKYIDNLSKPGANTAKEAHCSVQFGRLALYQPTQSVAPVRAANDNGTAIDNKLLNATLRHFARHGLRAAAEAKREAEAAFFRGDRAAYDWWLAICKTLDRRLAQQIIRDSELRN